MQSILIMFFYALFSIVSFFALLIGIVWAILNHFRKRNGR